MGTILAKISRRIIWTLLSEKVVIMVILWLGDKLVDSTENDLDNDVWVKVKAELKDS